MILKIKFVLKQAEKAIIFWKLVVQFINLHTVSVKSKRKREKNFEHSKNSQFFSNLNKSKNYQLQQLKTSDFSW